MAKDKLTNKWTRWLVVAVILVGAMLRLYGLKIQSLWCDELASWDYGHWSSVTEVMSKAVKQDLHPPGYHLLMHWIIMYWGDSEVMLRLPSVLAGILVIPAMYLLGKRIYGKSEGLIAAGLVAVTWAPVYYSQEARPYSLILLLTVLGMYWWMGVMISWKQKQKARTGEIFGYLLSAIGLTYLHYYGFLLVGLESVAALIYFKRNRYALTRWVGLYVSVGLSHLWWWPILGYQFSNNGQKISWITKPTVAVFLDYALWLFNNSAKLLLIVGALLTWWAGINLARIKTRRDLKKQLMSPGVFLGLWLVLPISIAFIASQMITPAMALRNLIISLPAALLLVARSTTQISRHKKVNVLVGTGLVILMLYQLVWRGAYYTKQTKEQYRQATQFITNHENEYPDAVIVGYEHVNRHFNYYLQRQGNPKKVEIMAGEAKDIGRLEEYLNYRQPKYFWYIRAHRIPEDLFIKYLDSHYGLIKKQLFIGADVWLYQTSYN